MISDGQKVWYLSEWWDRGSLSLLIDETPIEWHKDEDVLVIHTLNKASVFSSYEVALKASLCSLKSPL